MTQPRSLYDKIWDSHVVEQRDDGTAILYIDRHLIHEVTSPQAFDGLRLRGGSVRRPDLTLAVADHNLPTTARRDGAGKAIPIADFDSAAQLAALEANVHTHNIRYFDAHNRNQGIVHVVGPEQGFSLPGAVIVCGDSHTACHGGLGALAFGIGTSEVEHVLATQTLLLKKSRNMAVCVEGTLGGGVSAKDIILHITGVIGAAGGVGHVIEYRGNVIRDLSLEGRLTVSNMAIEGGARAGLIAPDETVFAYVKGRPMAPQGVQWAAAVEHWRSLATDRGAKFDKNIAIAASAIAPSVTWGTSPEDVVPITGAVPNPCDFLDAGKRAAAAQSLAYMGLEAGVRMQDIAVDNIFIGSCTNSRIEDLRAAAAVLKGRRKADSVTWALVVPGSGLVKAQAEAEGLDKIFTAAGLEWREPGCSACLGMNPDKVASGARCASTSNRNFVGRQGPGSRTHLLSPAMAAAAAVTGRLTDVRDLVDSKTLAGL